MAGLQKTIKAAVSKQIDAKLPWWESTALWACISIGGGIVFGVVAAVVADLRWMLIPAGFFFCSAAFVGTRKIDRWVPRWIARLILWSCTVGALLLLNSVLPEKAALRDSSSGATQSEVLSDPVVNIEPDGNFILWSTKPGQTLGVFVLAIANTGLVAVNSIDVQQDYFVAQGQRGEIIIKGLGGVPIDNRVAPLAAKIGRATMTVDFRRHTEIARQVMIACQRPSLLGVRVMVSFKRVMDGKRYSLLRDYAALNPQAPGLYGPASSIDHSVGPGAINIVSDGANFYANSLNAGKSNVALSYGRLRLGDVVRYLDLPSHWIPVTHEIGTDSNGNRVERYY